MGKHPLTRAEVNQLLAVVALGAAVGFIWQTFAELTNARRELRNANWKAGEATETAEFWEARYRDLSDRTVEQHARIHEALKPR